MNDAIADSVRAIAAVVSWGGGVALIWTAADRLHKHAAKPLRDLVVAIMNPSPLKKALLNWSLAFRDSINTVFTKKHWSWRCFSRSCLVSVICMIIGTAIIAVAKPRELWSGYRDEDWFSHMIDVLLVPWNFAIDFLALWVTRVFVNKMVAFKSAIANFLLILPLVAVHLVIIFIIATFWLWLANHLLVFFTELSGHVEAKLTYQKISRSAIVMWNLLTFQDLRPTSLINLPMYYSAFFAVVWLALYALATPLAQLGIRLESTMKFIRRSIKRNEPFHAFAVVLTVVWTIVYVCIVLPLAFLLSSSEAGLATQ